MIKSNILITVLITCIIFLSSSTFLSAQSELMFGVNAEILDKHLINVFNDSSKNYKEFFENFGIKYIRYPGGIPVRYYFWDNADKIPDALILLGNYLGKRGSKQGQNYESKADRFKLDSDNYMIFLNFCNRSGLIPVIQINTLFYIHNNQVYQIEEFLRDRTGAQLQPDRWDKIKAYINNQMDFTHSLIDNVIWEIGNEDAFIYKPDKYGIICVNMVEIIKSKYPNDKVIVEMTNALSGKLLRDRWNTDFINYLNEHNVLSKIDYFAPHFYDQSGKELTTQEEINDRVKSGNVDEFADEIISHFPENFEPKLFYTEYAAFLTAFDNKNFNTQLHALMMLNYLMRFEANRNIVGVINQGFSNEKNGMFLPAYSISKLEYAKQKLPKDETFAYISPQAEAVRLFYNTKKKKLSGFFENDNILALLTSDENGYILQILNFSNSSSTINLKEIFPEITNFNNISHYKFQNLDSHYWNPDETAVHQELIDLTITINPQSFVVVN